MQNFKVPNKKKKTHRILNFKGQRATRSTRANLYVIKAATKGILTFNQLSSFRKKTAKSFKPKGIILKWRIFPNYPFTHKPLGMRMGKGKGNPSSINDWKADCRRGRILFEITGKKFPRDALQRVIHKASFKLPKVKIRITRRRSNSPKKKRLLNLFSPTLLSKKIRR
jgi:large subunit ribosomal protein L16